jgi:putative flippase GtrA
MFKRESLLRLVRFGIVGVSVMVFFSFLNWLFSRLVSAQAAYFLAYPPALLLHYLLNKAWTFRDQRKTDARQVADYLFTVVVTFLIQWPVFTVMLHGLGWPSWLAAGFSNVVQMVASFLLMQMRVFGSSHGVDKRGAWHRLLILLTTLAAATIVVTTTTSRQGMTPIAAKQHDYYNLLLSGFLKGSLAVDAPVPDELKNVANPYDPSARPPGIAPADITYFKGKYYLYFGAVPILCVLAPFKLLTGAELPLEWVQVLFGTASCLLAAWLLIRVLRDHFSQASLATKLGGIGVVTFGGGQLALARRASIWEMPIAAGHFFLLATLVCGYLALSTRRSRPWLVLSGLSLGLAVGCRPTLIVAGPVLAVLVLTVASRAGGARRWRDGLKPALNAAIAAGLPLAAVVSGLLVYNYLRFENPLEFGLNYQLTGVYEAKAQHFSWDYFGFNWFMYFWAKPAWGIYFPFLHPVEAPPLPPRYYGYEYVYGALRILPVIWLVVFLPLCWLVNARKGGRPACLGGFVGMVLTVAICVSAVLLCFNTAAARYTADFIPWWLWLGVLGWAAIEALLLKKAALRSLARTLFGAAALVTCAAAFCASAELHGIWEFLSPTSYRRVSRVANMPTALWERWTDQPMGALEMDIVFPEKVTGSVEPLLVTGVQHETSYIYVKYHSPTHVQIGCTTFKGRELLSEVFTVEPGRRCRLRVECGSLYPPDGHSVYDSWTRGEVGSLKRWVRFEIDGKPVLNQAARMHESSPNHLWIGTDARGGYAGRRFTGQIGNIRRAGIKRIGMSTHTGGDVLLSITFPPASSLAQPLVVAGEPGKADLLGLRIQDSRFSFLYESWSNGIWGSPELELPTSGDAQFRIRLGSILSLDEASPLGVLRGTLAVWMNDRPVWWRQLAGPIAGDALVEVAANPIGSTGMQPFFDGRLRSFARTAPPAAWRYEPFARIDLTVAGLAAGAQPLVATGKTGKANTLALELQAGGMARLLYDHWGYSLHASEPFACDPAQLHVFEIEMPSFPLLGTGKGAESGRLRVVFDGKEVWSQSVPCYAAEVNTVAIARNVAGASIAQASLGGVVIDIRQQMASP